MLTSPNIWPKYAEISDFNANRETSGLNVIHLQHSHDHGQDQPQSCSQQPGDPPAPHLQCSRNAEVTPTLVHTFLICRRSQVLPRKWHQWPMFVRFWYTSATKLLCRLLQSLWLTVLQNVNADTRGEHLAKSGKNSSNSNGSGVYWPKTLGSAQCNSENLSWLFTSKCWVTSFRCQAVSVQRWQHTCSFHRVADQCSGAVGLPYDEEDRREQCDDHRGNPMICTILAPWKLHEQSKVIISPCLLLPSRAALLRLHHPLVWILPFRPPAHLKAGRTNELGRGMLEKLLATSEQQNGQGNVRSLRRHNINI